ncbi:MAG TPA: response regulator transcription factor [Bacteroidales bacterium]|nr:response regulator transcription factor [Bacteroidales bacterium]HRT89022.1 response regulator transcription factor [Bacteroidales bacterium]
MKTKRILLAEDDRNLGALLSNYLNMKHFETTLCSNGKEALEVFRKDAFDLCILDIMMPEIDGITLARELRKIQPDIPIIFLTAKNLKEDVIEGFKSGADDYITKPFSMDELIYRIEAILRRIIEKKEYRKEDEYIIGAYRFDTVKQILTIGNESMQLTTKESELLELLCRHRNEILERNYALRTIWIDDNYFNARSMDVYITKLRKYLKKDPSVKILNVHGKGYKLLAE